MSFTKFAQAIPLRVMGLALVFAARLAQAQTETVLYNFTGGTYDPGPASGLTSDSAGNFYGTTAGEGLEGFGTVFELSPNGSGGWNETVLYNFTGGVDGGNPSYSRVIFDGAGNIYGTTERGGAYENGVVFKLSPAGANWTETTLHSFAGGADGFFPLTGLIMEPVGNLYGTTWAGGALGGGTVFELSKSGGVWTEQVIYAAGASKYGMTAGLTMDAAGNIFGVSYSTIFELSPNGIGGWNPTVLHTFIRNPKGGNFLAGTPVLDKAGNLYGTTTAWNAQAEFSHDFRGTVYELSPGKNGQWIKKTLFIFLPYDGALEGNAPYGGVVLDGAGNIYGTTIVGGAYGQGTVFELVASAGTGSYTEKVLWSFNGTDGSQPYGGVILDRAGNLYGTTAYGGTGDGGNGFGGVVFEVTP